MLCSVSDKFQTDNAKTDNAKFVTDNAKLLVKNFSKNSYLDDTVISSPDMSCLWYEICVYSRTLKRGLWLKTNTLLVYFQWLALLII